MQTPASISRHPVHPMLIVLPVGLWIFSLFCDLLYLGGGEAEIWSRLALYAMVGGFIGALMAALAGFVGPTHVTINLIVVTLYAVNIWLRFGDPANLAMAIVLSVTGIGMLAVSNWLGGGMVRLRKE